MYGIDNIDIVSSEQDAKDPRQINIVYKVKVPVEAITISLNVDDLE
jgi:hypothetical protein